MQAEGSQGGGQRSRIGGREGLHNRAKQPKACRLMAAKEEDEEGGEEQEPHTWEQIDNRLQVGNLIITFKRYSQLNNSRQERSIEVCLIYRGVYISNAGMYRSLYF